MIVSHRKNCGKPLFGRALVAISGVYFIDKLPFGTYYLHEIKNASGENVDIWFTLTVNENGAGYEKDDLKVSNTFNPETTAPD